MLNHLLINLKLNGKNIQIIQILLMKTLIIIHHLVILHMRKLVEY